MSILDKYETSEHRKNTIHLATIIKMAIIDGEINPEEEKLLQSFANKLNISKEEYKVIMNTPDKYPLDTVNSKEKRLEYMFDLFKIIYVDHYIDEAEKKLVLKYAIGLGCHVDKAHEVIEKSIKLFGGGLDLEDYKYLMNK